MPHGVAPSRRAGAAGNQQTRVELLAPGEIEDGGASLDRSLERVRVGGADVQHEVETSILLALELAHHQPPRARRGTPFDVPRVVAGRVLAQVVQLGAGPA